MISTVKLTKTAQHGLTSCPDYIASKFKYWVSLVETMGLEAVRKIKGFHDEPLKGKRSGQRSFLGNLKNFLSSDLQKTTDF